MVGDGLDVAVPQEAERHAISADVLGVGNMLLDFRIWEGRAGADGAIVHQSATLNDFCSVSNRDFRIVKNVIGPLMADPQFGNLAGSA